MPFQIAQCDVVEMLGESRRARVCRGRRRADGLPVILKSLKPEATADDLARFRNEFALLARASGPGIIKAQNLEQTPDGSVMVLEDIGGTSLDRLTGGQPLPQFLDLAIGLAGTLAGLHQQRIIHKAICPAHIVLNSTTGEFRLIGFAQAEELSPLSAAVQPPAALEGDLAYLSPEQTGRMNRPVDYRSDFYSLGVTFYQLLTGKPPFQADDALGLIHCHIAATATAPHEVNPAIPEMLSRIVLKLMAKMAEDRYQSAWGLQADLERCRKELTQNGTIPCFELGQQDFSDQLKIPQKLYGREQEVTQLRQAFWRVREGDRELLLVAGYAGVGKTALVQEVHRPVVEARGCFLEGKFDQLQRSVPYFAWIQVFTGLVHSLLMESEGHLAQWRLRILQAVGNIGRVLTEVIANLELIIGPQPEVPALGPTEAQNRLSYVFLRLIRALATPEHPLVVFLDDLQWIDAASLNLLQTLLGSIGVSHLLVIGAYRDNEVDALHPVRRSVELLQREGARVERMSLPDLTEPTVNMLLAETLRVPLERAQPLTHLIYARTGGNPFFLLQTLRALVEKQAIRFDLAGRCWRWEMSRLQEMEIADNVVALMLGKIQQLPPPAQRLLPLAACMGFRFDLANLAIIAQQSEEVALDHLQSSLREELITPQEGAFQFAHDRIQQAAYALIPEAEKKQVHLTIGRLLRQHMPEGGHDEQLFTVADHLNSGAGLLQGRAEKLELARLNLRAGSKARASAAFSAATRYFEAGVGILPEECWECDFDLALDLHTRAAEGASLTGDFERTDELFRVVTGNARAAVDLVGVYESKMHCYVSQGRLQDVLDTALEILEKLGMGLPAYPSDNDIKRSMAETKSLYAAVPIEDLVSLPKMTDPNKLAILRVESRASPSAFLGRTPLCVLFVFEIVGQHIRYGNTIESPFSFATYAVMLCGLLREYETGCRFGNLASALLETTDKSPFRSKTYEVIAGHVRHFKEHLRTTLPLLEAGYLSGLEDGDFEYAGFNAFFYCCNAFFAGVNLRELGDKMASYNDAMLRVRAETGRRWQAPYWQATLNLLSPCGDPCSFSGEGFSEDEILPVLEQTHNTSALAALGVSKMMVCYLFGNSPQAMKYAELADKNKGGMLAMFSQSASMFYDSLINIQAYPGQDALTQAQMLARVAASQGELKRLADSAPMNFLHKFHLVEAERMRLAGDGMAALDHYDKAISLARESGYVQEEALANELAAKFCLEKGKEGFARLYMVKARNCYESWGALRKVRDLEERYSNLLPISPQREMASIAAEQLDLSTLMKAEQAISSEIEMNKLLGEIMRIVLENAGAERGYLLTEKDGAWVVAAQGDAGKSEVEIPRLANIEQTNRVSPGVVHFVARTKQAVVLHDAVNMGEFTSDPYIRREKTRSLVCAPLLSAGRLIGIQYLENNLTTHAFTPDRIQFLEMLLSQAAISLENAGVYQALKESEASYRRIVDMANEGIWVIGSDTLTTSVNARMAEMLGRTPTEILGQPLTDFMYEDDIPDHLQEIGNRRRGIAGHYERRFRRQDGSVVWTIASASPLFDAQHRFEGSFAMYTDITERKRAEEVAAASQKLLQDFTDNSSSLMYACDRQGRFLFVNRRFADLFGVSRESLIRKTREAIIPPETAAAHRDNDQKVIDIQQPIVTEEENDEADGKHTYLTVKFPITDAQGNVLWVGGISTDITEHKRAEEQIRRFNQELEQRVHQRTAQLEAANKELESFSYSVSHDLRAPLRAITGFSHILQEKYKPSLGSECQRLLDLVNQGALRMGRLIDDILAFSRTSRTKMGVKIVDMTTLAREAFAEQHANAPKREIRFTLDILPPATGDRAMLRQVWGNLLGNAIKYTAQREEAVIEVSGSIQGNEAIYCVKDNGAGFDMQYAAKLFGVFQRLHSESQFEGTGIGLAIVQRIIARHGGRAWAEGKVDQGATFHFALPCPMK